MKTGGWSTGPRVDASSGIMRSIPTYVKARGSIEHTERPILVDVELASMWPYLPSSFQSESLIAESSSAYRPTIISLKSGLVTAITTPRLISCLLIVCIHSHDKPDRPFTIMTLPLPDLQSSSSSISSAVSHSITIILLLLPTLFR